MARRIVREFEVVGYNVRAACALGAQSLHPSNEVLDMTYDVSQLLKLSQAQLDELFTSSPAGDIPDGEAKGTAIIAPATQYTADIAEVINHFGWQGKVFDAKRGLLKNRILVFGIQAIIAKVYKGPSWVDGKECIVLDYSETSLVAQRIRD